MKIKTLILSAVFAGSFALASAQNFENGDMIGNLGLSFGWYGYGYGVTSFPAISVSLEKGIKELDFGNIGVGGIVGYKHAKYNWAYGDDWSWTDFIIAARGALHVDLLKSDKVDTYAGVALGVRIESEKYYVYVYPYGTNDYEKAHNNYTHGLFAGFVGARYYVSDNFGLFGELGYGIGYATVGVSYKF